MGWTPVPSPTDRVRAFAPAKINLFLHVGDKRADGYHALESLAVFAEIGDALTFEAFRRTCRWHWKGRSRST